MADDGTPSSTPPFRDEEAITLKRKKRPFLALLFGCFVAGILLEGMLRIDNPFTPRLRGERILLPRYARYEIERTDLVGVPSRIVHTKNSLGFRGPEPPADFESFETIITVGGSTTECFFLNDGTCWTSRMADRLAKEIPRLWVNNAGLDGHSTFGHAILVRDVLRHLRPKWVFFLVGLNEVGRDDLTRWDRDFLGERDDLASRLKTWARKSEIVLLLQNLRRCLLARRLVIHRAAFDIREVPAGWIAPERAAAILASHTPYLEAYRQRLLHILDLCRAASIQPVFITQPALYGEGIDPATGVDLASRGEGEGNWTLQWAILEKYNDITRTVGAEQGIWVIDLAHLLPKDSRYFYDTHHFSTAGAEAVGTIVAEEFLRYWKKRP